MTGNPTLDRIILAVCLTVSLGVTGLFVYTEMFYKKKLPSNTEEKELMVSDSKKIVVPKGHTIKKIIVNLPSEGSRLRFLNLGILFIPFEESLIPYLEKNNDVIQDAIISTASAIPANELNSITGKILLEERLKKNIQAKLGDELIKEIYFTNYVVQ